MANERESSQCEHQHRNDDDDIKFYRGLPLPSIFKDDVLDSALEYEHQDGDVILCTFPKTGSTWTTNILWQILHKAQVPVDKHMFKNRYILVPFLERSETEQLKLLSPPRFYRTHFPVSFLKFNPRAKYVYTFRHPEDTVVSFYHYLKASDRIKCNFDSFFDDFVSGTSVYGSYFEHLHAAHAYRNCGNFLFASYEDLKGDTGAQVLRIAKFLGEDFHGALLADGGLLDKVLELTSFQYMKSHSVFALVPGVEGDTVELNLYRKGEIGEGKMALTQSQRRILRERVSDSLKDTEFFSLWYG